MPTDTHNRAEPKAAKRIPRSSTRIELLRVTHEIERICADLQPSDRIPTHTELMARLNASARVVLNVLNTLQHSGRIVRRAGAGTFIPSDRDSVDGPSITVAEPPMASQTVVVVSAPDNSFFAYFGDLMLGQCESRGLDVVYHPIRINALENYTPKRHVGSDNVYLVLGSSLLPLADRLKLAGYRVVAIADPAVHGKPTEVPCVHVDNIHGGYLAAQHLIQLGHRRIAYAGREAEGPRWEGLLQAVNDAKSKGLSVKASLVSRTESDSWSVDPGKARAFFAHPDHPTGLCVWNDRTAIELMHTLTRAGIQVPEQVSMVGYDNLPDDIAVSPSLTTIDQCVDQQIRIALRLLSQALPPATSHTTLITPILLARDSTCPWSHPAGGQSE